MKKWLWILLFVSTIETVARHGAYKDSVSIAETSHFKLIDDTLVFIDITIKSDNEYPVHLQALNPLADTLYVNRESITAFIESIYSNAKYVDEAHTWMTEYLEMASTSGDMEDKITKYEKDLYSALHKWAKHKSFSICQGQYEVDLKYINISGIFMVINDMSRHIGSSIGINPQNYSVIHEIWVPVDVATFCQPENMPIRFIE